MLVVAALAWHALVVVDHFRQAHKEKHGRDFASYYYAVQVAADGGDPYARGSLGAASRQDQTRKGVHPFFYPPPFLLGMVWAIPLDLVSAYRAWFWLDELFTLLAFAVLWRWWRPMGSAVPVVLALTLAALTGLPNNHLMGQMNMPTFFAVVVGLMLADRERPIAGGVMMGIACMSKMAPALFVAWWLLRGRLRAAGASVATAGVLSVLSLPLVGLSNQIDFYTQVLPGFSSGDYNGLMVGINLFGNHSIPNLLDGMLPSAERPHLRLSTSARLISTMTALSMLAGLAMLFRHRDVDGLARAGQIGAVGVVMVLVPVITYEHHLVWVTPAVVAVAAALEKGRLDARWTIPVALAASVWCFELQTLKDLHMYLRSGYPTLALGVREAKFMALLVLLAASTAVGASREEA